MTRCQACEKDANVKHGRKSAYTREAMEVCRRVRRKSPQWWEREPGWARRNVAKELALQSRRLAAQPPFDYQVFEEARQAAERAVQEAA